MYLEILWQNEPANTMTIPYRGQTSQSTYFITANSFQKKKLFQVDKNVLLFIEVLFHYRQKGNYLLHEFVLMPDHFHLLVTPSGITLERSVQVRSTWIRYLSG